MGAADVVEPSANPPYPQDKFDENLPAWRKAIKDGKATADKIVGKLKSANTITTEQEQAIRADVQDDPADQQAPEDQTQGEQQ